MFFDVLYGLLWCHGFTFLSHIVPCRINLIFLFIVLLCLALPSQEESRKVGNVCGDLWNTKVGPPTSDLRKAWPLNWLKVEMFSILVYIIADIKSAKCSIVRGRGRSRGWEKREARRSGWELIWELGVDDFCFLLLEYAAQPSLIHESEGWECLCCYMK